MGVESVTWGTRSDVWNSTGTSPKSHTAFHNLVVLTANFGPRRGYALLMELLQHSSIGAYNQVDVRLHTQIKIPKIKIPKMSKMKISKIKVPSIKDTKDEGIKDKGTKYQRYQR